MELEAKIALLARTPALLDAWLRDLGHGLGELDEGPGTFSALDIVGHLIEGERHDWIPRARVILEEGEARPFEPFDRFSQEAMTEGLEERLDLFASLRRENLETLRSWNLNAAQLAATGMHPDLGRVTLAELLSTWTAHDLVHLRQAARVMWKSIAPDIGPWRKYLSRS